jgi:hypothetical protein
LFIPQVTALTAAQPATPISGARLASRRHHADLRLSAEFQSEELRHRVPSGHVQWREN